MKVLNSLTALYTDFHQLKMAQGYLLSGKAQYNSVFDYFLKENPFGGGYVVFAGMTDFLEILESLRFGNVELEYLESLGFGDEMLRYLKSFCFSGTVYAMREGELVFPLEPIVRIDGNLIECQIIETLLLNILNFESLIATKASRIRYAAGNCRVVDFGLRRAQGLGGVHASRAAIIGGIDATSNLFAAHQFGLEVDGTQSHSWIQSFGDELTAFRKYSEIYPDDCVLLIDTYNTMRSGLPNAIKIAKELELKGKKLRAVRIDGGDLVLMSKKIRANLDAANLKYVQIIVSNQLDEYLITSLIQQGAPIDAFGIGTRLLAAHNYPSLHGVFQQCISGDQPTLKFSDNYAKTTLPGRKKVMRYFDSNGLFDADGIMLENEEDVEILYHPVFSEQQRNIEEYTARPLLSKFMENGQITEMLPSASESGRYVTHRLVCLPPEYRRLDGPKPYKVGISPSLMRLRSFLFEQMQKGSMVGR